MPRDRGVRGGATSTLTRYAVLGVAIAAWHLTALPTIVTSCVVFFMPIEEDVKIGAAFIDQNGLEGRTIRDRALDDVLEVIGGRLLGALSRSQREQYAWQFQVVNDDGINAFALPGGFVYINRGLIGAAQSAEEVAGVLAHEMGHVLARHSQKRMIEQQLISTLIEAMVHDDGDDERESFGKSVAETLARGATQLSGLKFSRANEYEADARGAQLLQDAGIGIGGMVSFFESLLRLEAQARTPGASLPPVVPASVEGWLSTHPATSERIRGLRAQVDALPEAERRRAWSGAGRALSRDLDWAAVRRAARGLRGAAR